MSKQLPLNALRVFEAAARHSSFRLAAEELHITPSAVSQQVRSLEQLLEVPLFYRMTRSVALTPAGQAGLAKLREGFGNLAEALRLMERRGARRSLSICVAPSLASKWLVPRLPLFTAAYPDIDLRISVDEALIDRDPSLPGSAADSGAEGLHSHRVDLAIRFGRGDYPGCRVDTLLPVAAVPLCSPRLLQGEQPLRNADDLAHHTLLHDDTSYDGRPGWADWLAAVGAEKVDASHGLHFNSAALALDAAVDGQGVVLSLEPLATDDLAAGRLVIPFGPRLPLKHAYHLVSLEDADEDADEASGVTRFRDWLLAVASEQRDREPRPARSRD